MSTISVIIPVFNGARHIAETIQSVLHQTRVPDEIIIVNDGSTDETPEILESAKSAGITVIHQENRGAGAARNRGMETATGSLVSFLDADDLWLPEKLAIQENYLSAHPDIGYVLCHLVEFHSPEMADSLRNRTPLRTGSQPGMLPSTALIRKSVIETVGLFTPVWRTGEFLDWTLRANEAGVTRHQLPDVLVKRRVHDTNLGRSASAARDYHHIIKAALDRKRNRGDQT